MSENVSALVATFNQEKGEGPIRGLLRVVKVPLGNGSFAALLPVLGAPPDGPGGLLQLEV